MIPVADGQEWLKANSRFVRFQARITASCQALL
jgi:hypothetical protein